MPSLEARLEAAIEEKQTPIANVLRHFRFKHLPEHLRVMSERFAELAMEVADAGSNAETTVALRKLLEGKDAAVRSLL